MFSPSDLFVSSFWPWLILALTIASVIIEGIFADKKFIFPWISVSVCVISTVILILLKANLSDLLIYITATLVSRLAVTLAKGGKKNDI